jgi:acyl-coenzyme A thioesterase PaaI-like protein
MTTNIKSLQERFGPNSICFGCGPKNPKGLQIRSFPDGDQCVCSYQPQAHHQAFAGTLNGGFLGCLFDCHCNWTAAWGWHQAKGGAFPSTVTSEFHVRLKRPTPAGAPLKLLARALRIENNLIYVEAELLAHVESLNSEIRTATCSGVFVVVEDGHPAYHRWD